MLVMILESVPTSLRGEITRWLVEPHAGVFVGHVNGMVRERLWEKCCKLAGTNGGVVQIWSTNTEQHFMMRLHGNTQRNVIELEGLQFIQEVHPTEKVQNKLKAVLIRAKKQSA
jgi:CRISPR-associated protein Cas2